MPDFKKYFTIHASIENVYNALVDTTLIEVWTNDDVVMEEIPGTEFSLFGGEIVGKNLEFEHNKKIVQEWYFDGELEPSIVTIILHQVKNATSVEVRQTNIPEDAWDNITEGWSESYIGSIQELLEEN